MTFTKLPKAITAEELLSTPLPPVKWIVPGLLPAGLALFAGPSKAGKSWLTLWLCLQVAQGMRIKPAQFPVSPMTISCNASSQQQAITYKILKKGDATMNPTSVEAGAEVAKSAMETVIAAIHSPLSGRCPYRPWCLPHCSAGRVSPSANRHPCSQGLDRLHTA